MGDHNIRQSTGSDTQYQQTQAAQNCDEALRQDSFTGLNLGFFRIGTQNGSLTAGIDLGIVNADASLGCKTGARGGVDLGPIGSADGGAAVRVDSRGLHGDAHGGAQALEIVGGQGNVGADLGQRTGARGGAGAYVGPIEAGARASTYAAPDGITAKANAGAEVDDVVKVHGKAHLKIGDLY